MADALLRWLIDINSVSDDEVDKYTGVAAAATVGAFLQESGPTVETMLEYLDEHYDDGIVLQPMLAQLLTALHRGGPLRVFALQFVPTIMHAYLSAVSLGGRRQCMHLQTFLLAVYNHEILVDELSAAAASAHRMDSPDSLLTAPIRRGPSPAVVIVQSGKPPLRRRADTVRVAPLTQPSVYHDPAKLTQSVLASDNSMLARLAPPSCSSSSGIGGGNGGGGDSLRHTLTTTVSVGPYAAYERMTVENRYTILARICRSVHSHLAQMYHASVLPSICDLVTCMCRNGFDFTDAADLTARVLQRVDSHQPGGGMLTVGYANTAGFSPSTSNTSPMVRDGRRASLRTLTRMNTLSNGVMPQQHRTPLTQATEMLATTSTLLAPRIAVDNCLLIELLQSVYYALFNGYHECALLALDSVHQRARYELMADVLLTTNAIINSLLENPSGAPVETSDPMGIRIITNAFDKSPNIRRVHGGGSNLITAASLRMRRMPEDIPIKDEDDVDTAQTGGGGGKSSREKGELASAFRKKLVQLRPDTLMKQGENMKRHLHIGGHHSSATAAAAGDGTNQTQPTTNGIDAKEHHHQTRIMSNVRSRLKNLRQKSIVDSAPLIETSETSEPATPAKTGHMVITEEDTVFDSTTATITDHIVDRLVSNTSTGDDYFDDDDDQQQQRVVIGAGHEQEARAQSPIVYYAAATSRQSSEFDLSSRVDNAVTAPASACDAQRMDLMMRIRHVDSSIDNLSDPNSALPPGDTHAVDAHDTEHNRIIDGRHE